MQHIVLDEPFYKQYNLTVEEYENIPVGTISFSVRVINRLMGNDITTVAALLKTAPADLMKLKNFGRNCLDEVTNFCSSLSEDTSKKVLDDGTKFFFHATPLFKVHRDEIAIGDFSAFDESELSDDETKLLQRYKDAYSILEKDLAFDCVVCPEKITPTIEMFSDYIKHQKILDEIFEIANSLPERRKNNKAFGYINAFTLSEDERALLKDICVSDEATLLSMAGTAKIDEPATYFLLKRFFRWCAFDLKEEIETLFSNLYSNDRIRTIIQMRARKQTLEQIGNHLGVTRERIRQIEVKAKKTFSRLHSRIRIISKIAAERNGDIVLSPTEIEEYCGTHTSDLLFFLQSYESSNYTYDRQLDLFILGDDSISSRVQSCIELLPDIVSANQLESILGEAADETDIPYEMLEKAFVDAYRLTGEVYHRYRLSLAAIYERILDKHYPQGFKAYDAEEIQRFREIVSSEYGDVGLPENDHALTTRIASICILCGRGVYRLKKKDYLSRNLANKICEYIENSENTIFLTNTLFSVFEEELLAEGIDNKYFLQGALREVFEDKFFFRRDYISKDADITSVYSSVVEFIKKSDFPVSKMQIQKAFPGITEIVMSFSVGDPNVLNYFGEYLHASKLNILDGEKEYLFDVIRRIVRDGKTHHVEEIYDVISQQKPEIFTRNAAMYPFSAFSIIEFLFRDKFQFSRPYIAKNGIEFDRPSERLHDLIYSCDEFNVSQISEFTKENHFYIQSLLDYINGCNDEFLLVNDDLIMRIGLTGIDETIISQVEDIIFNAVTETIPIKDLTIWSELPSVNVPWTEWFIYSVLFKWSKRLSVSTSNNQLRLAIPLVAPKGQMDESKYRNMSKESSTTQPICVDNLDDIDDLIADFINLDDEWRTEDEF